MKQLFLLVLTLLSVLPSYSNTPILLNPTTPPPRVGEESMTMMSSVSTTLKKSSTLKTSSSTVYSPVSAYVDEVALTVTFTESVGIANVLVYDANNQLVDMVTVDTSNVYEAVLATDTWASGSYKLVVTYGATTLEGNFDF